MLRFKFICHRVRYKASEYLSLAVERQKSLGKDSTAIGHIQKQELMGRHCWRMQKRQGKRSMALVDGLKRMKNIVAGTWEQSPERMQFYCCWSASKVETVEA